MRKDMIRKVQQLWSSVIQDREALFELRQLIMGILIAIGVTYGFYTFHVETKEKVKQENLANKLQMTASVGGKELDDLSTLQLQKIIKLKKEIEEKISLLELKKKLLWEQYATGQSIESFIYVIFTLQPISPVDIESGFVEMNGLETRSYDFFDVNAVKLQGDLMYAEFLNYLMYLENRPEVGMIDNLNLEILLEEPAGSVGKVHFTVALGRILLHPVQ